MTFASRRSILGALVAGALLAGCAAAPKRGGPSARAAPEIELAAKQFQPPKPGLAAVYVYRTTRSLGGFPTGLLLNGQLVGATEGRSFLWFWVGPGKHQLVTNAGNDAMLEIEAQPGATYFVRQDVGMGFLAPRSVLQLVDEATGRAGVSECSLLADGSAPTR